MNKFYAKDVHECKESKDIRMIRIEINNAVLRFKTSSAIFSPSGIDKGTLALISQVSFDKNDKILDLGCGYGFVGIYASKIIEHKNIVMSDISDDAIELSKYNAKLNGSEGISIVKSDCLNNIKKDNFSLILSNPPYHADFAVPKKLIEQSYKKLKIGGKMYMVTKRKDWYKNKFISIFGGVDIKEIDGYFIFMAQKRKKQDSSEEKNFNNMSKKLRKKYFHKNL